MILSSPVSLKRNRVSLPQGRRKPKKTVNKMNALKDCGNWLKEVVKGGRIIILGDESMWEVPTISMGDTCTWHLVSPISVLYGDNPSYPYKLVNTDNNEIVDAKYLGN